MKIIDLHNDLLSFLIHSPGRNPSDPASRSSYPQMSQGGIATQLLAIFSKTEPSSVLQGGAQVNAFKKLLDGYPQFYSQEAANSNSSCIRIISAIENASCFASESEPLSIAIQRLENYIGKVGPLLYISFTWNDENRFGGGNQSTVGLKEDGKQLLEWMDGKKISIDMSHTSDKLAHEIIECIDTHNYAIPLLASHSNFRAVSPHLRNLPDSIAKELIRRKGIIGLNFFSPFIHPSDPSALARHVEYGIELGGSDSLCFGADFFCERDFPSFMERYKEQIAFFPELGNSSSYPHALALFEKKLHLKQGELEKIAYQNAEKFLREQWTYQPRVFL